VCIVLSRKPRSQVRVNCRCSTMFVISLGRRLAVIPSCLQVLKEIEFSSKAQEFLAQLNELKNVVLQRLLTTPLEVLQRKEFLEDVQTNTDKISVAIENMHDDLEDATLDAGQKVLLISSSSSSSSSSFCSSCSCSSSPPAPPPTFCSFFYPRDAMLARSFRQQRVCLSVCPSVTRRYCA